uniref:Integrase, catalytic region, zinc finger, CCHC-type, peptidase aspartic, catalytic n=1 Tax=Tanacetum cinerariifolium TaxID=118510 RepID=A0A6L2LMR1_TANCI|nr:hypothetical protein [Tanacetum cinerariifolium]
MSTFAEYMIVAGAENYPPMLDKTMYNSWQSRMLLYLKGKKNGRMMLISIQSGSLVYPTIEEKSQVRDKKVLMVWELREMLQVQGETIRLVNQGLLSVITTRANGIWQGGVLSQKGQGILHDPRISDGQAIQKTIPQNAAFQIDDLDAYDSDCDDISSAKEVLMANLSSYNSDVLSKTQDMIVQDTNSSA